MRWLGVAAATTAWAIPVAILVNYVVPDPYMDEIFHIPQAQRYCRGDFRYWDPMITTPPGLYCLSLAYVGSLFPGLWITGISKSFPDLCSTLVLRSTNIVAAVLCSILIYDLLVCIRPSVGQRKATLYAILISLYPIHWFFTFLYYTDVISLGTVLAMHFAILKRKFWLGSLFGSLAILFRQTNVIWMCFFAANEAIAYIDECYAKEILSWKKVESVPGFDESIVDESSLHANIPRRRKISATSKNSTQHANSSQNDIVTFQGLFGEMLDFVIKLWSVKWKVLFAFAPFVLVIFAFVIFVLWNGSIVLGAKEAHVVSPHFAQMLYFSLFSSLALFPLHFTFGQASNLFKRFRKKRVYGCLIICSLLAASFVAVHFFSIAHPYLLADNRHYTFYIWRKVIQAHWTMKYLLIPLYLYSWFSIAENLGQSHTRFWVISFIMSVALVLVPAPLIEFRYFTIPLVLIALHSPVINERSLLFLGSLYVLVNLSSLAMFLFRTFRWNTEPGLQRFMW